MRALLLILLFAAFTAVQAQISLAPGAKMPSVSADWILKGQSPERPAVPPENFKNFQILTFADALSPDFPQTLALMASLEEMYGGKTEHSAVLLQTVAKNSKEELTRALGANRPELNLGVDKDGRTYRNFAVGIASLPYTFISRNGAIVWSGHPVEIESVMDALLADRFSLAGQRKVAELRSELQTALRAGLPDVVAQTADKILAVSPGDAIALQARLYAFQLKRQTAGAAKFLAEHIQKHPESKLRIRLTLLNLLRNAPSQEWNRAVAETAAFAEKSPMNALLLAQALLQIAEPPQLPARQILELAKQAEAYFRTNGKKQLLAQALETLARANYATCRLDDAIAAQREAVQIREERNDSGLLGAKEMLNFYENLKKL